MIIRVEDLRPGDVVVCDDLFHGAVVVFSDGCSVCLLLVDGEYEVTNGFRCFQVKSFGSVAMSDVAIADGKKRCEERTARAVAARVEGA